MNNNDPIPTGGISITRGGFASCLFIRRGGTYVHGGTLSWFGSGYGDLVQYNASVLTGSRRLTQRLCTYYCCCCPGVDMPAVFDHKTDEYVGALTTSQQTNHTTTTTTTSPASPAQLRPAQPSPTPVLAPTTCRYIKTVAEHCKAIGATDITAKVAGLY